MPKFENEMTYSTLEELVKEIYIGSPNLNSSETSYLDSILETGSKYKYNERKRYLQADRFPAGNTIISIPRESFLSALPRGINHEPHSIVWHAIGCGNKPALKIILTHESGMPNCCTKCDEHPIIQAAAMRSEDMVRMLLDCPDLDLNLECNSRDEELLKRLLKRTPSLHEYRNVGVMLLTILNMQEKSKLAKEVVAKMTTSDDCCYNKAQLNNYLSKGTPLPLPHEKLTSRNQQRRTGM